MGCGGATKEETNLLITFHHNWFDHCDSRCPRLNHTTAHIYNNYYDGNATYGIGCTEVSNAFIECNYFRNLQRPMMIAGQGTDYIYASQPEKGTFSGQPGGMSKAYNNKVENSTMELRLFYQTDDAQEFDAWLVEKRGDKVNVRHILKKPIVSDEAIEKAQNRLDSIADDIRAGKFTFEDGASLLSDDKDTRSNKGLMSNSQLQYGRITSRFQMQDLPPEVAKVVDTMQVGQISKSFQMINQKGKTVCVIAKLKSRVDGHRANISDDYQVLKEVVLNKRREEVLHQWVVDKIKGVYTRLNDNYRDCKFEYEGWIK